MISERRRSKRDRRWVKKPGSSPSRGCSLSDLWRDALTLWSTASLSIKQRGWTRCSVMPLPAQCVSERFISTSFKLWSNARLGNSSEKRTINMWGNSGSFSESWGWEVDSRAVRRNSVSGGGNRAYEDGKQFKWMRSVRNEHRNVLETDLPG